LSVCRTAWVLCLLCLLSVVAVAQEQRATVHLQVKVEHASGADGGDDRNVIVWLQPLDSTADPKARPAQHYSITQKNKEFIPHVLAVPVGTKIEFPNKDPFFHNVFSLYQGKRFDLGLYEAGTTREVLFDRPGVSFIFCNIHPDMSAYVVALQTPYFDTTGKDGRIVIAQVPAGRYRLQVWYERAETADLAKLSRVVEISGRDTDLGTIEVPESAKSQPEHSNKHGKAYDPEQPPY
jgi:plastocyanin